MKLALTTTSVLDLLDFPMEFTVETDVEGDGIGVFLPLNNKSIVFFNKVLSTQSKAFSVYERATRSG